MFIKPFDRILVSVFVLMSISGVVLADRGLHRRQERKDPDPWQSRKNVVLSDDGILFLTDKQLRERKEASEKRAKEAERASQRAMEETQRTQDVMEAESTIGSIQERIVRLGHVRNQLSDDIQQGISLFPPEELATATNRLKKVTILGAKYNKQIKEMKGTLVRVKNKEVSVEHFKEEVSRLESNVLALTTSLDQLVVFCRQYLRKPEEQSDESTDEFSNQ